MNNRRVQYDGSTVALTGEDAERSLEEIKDEYRSVYGSEIDAYDIQEDETGLITFNPRPGQKGIIK